MVGLRGPLKKLFRVKSRVGEDCGWMRGLKAERLTLLVDAGLKELRAPSGFSLLE